MHCIIIYNLVCFVFDRVGELLFTIIIIIINLEQSCDGKRRREVIAFTSSIYSDSRLYYFTDGKWIDERVIITTVVELNQNSRYLYYI